MPLLEIIRFWYGYLFASILFALVAKKVLPYNRNLLSYLALGLLPSIVWYGIRPPHRIHQELPLLAVYGLTGLLYGWLYYRYFVKTRPLAPQTQAELLT